MRQLRILKVDEFESLFRHYVSRSDIVDELTHELEPSTAYFTYTKWHNGVGVSIKFTLPYQPVDCTVTLDKYTAESVVRCLVEHPCTNANLEGFGKVSTALMKIGCSSYDVVLGDLEDAREFEQRGGCEEEE